MHRCIGLHARFVNTFIVDDRTTVRRPHITPDHRQLGYTLFFISVVYEPATNLRANTPVYILTYTSNPCMHLYSINRNRGFISFYSLFKLTTIFIFVFTLLLPPKKTFSRYFFFFFLVL